jgi:RHS repeat-associated protein
LNAAGSVLAARTFAPYGTTASSAGTFGSRYSFAGEMLDGAISYNRARYYHTGIASWLSLDPFEGTADAPLSLSGYGYGHGNPVNMTDASGENPALAIPALAGGSQQSPRPLQPIAGPLRTVPRCVYAIMRFPPSRLYHGAA